MRIIKTALLLMLMVMLASCGSVAETSTAVPAAGAATSTTTSGTAAGSSREITWLLSRPSDGPVIAAVKEVADEYAQAHPGFKLNFVTTPDRPSYLQKVQTLAAANQLPEMFDTDATPFAEKLKNQGFMVDIAKFLKDTGKYDQYRSAALDYQRFDDGGLYLLPWEFHMEWFWYNKAIFQKAGVQVPQTLEDIVKLCAPLRAAGYIPMALDGQDQWPLLRQMAFIPFRLTGNDYVKQLKKAATTLSSEPGQRAAQYVYDLGKNNCFQEGFSSQGYTDARDLFSSGKAAIYYMGTWELGTFTADTLPAEVKDNIDYFTMPMTEGATTSPNDYFVVSGIGMALNAKTFDPVVQDFVSYLIDKYPARYAAKQQFPPMQTTVTAPANASALYSKVIAELGKLGTKFGVPWDTQLDPTSNTRLEQELTLLAQNETTPEQFISTVDEVIKENAPKYFAAP